MQCHNYFIALIDELIKGTNAKNTNFLNTNCGFREHLIQFSFSFDVLEGIYLGLQRIGNANYSLKTPSYNLLTAVNGGWLATRRLTMQINHS